MPIANQWVPSGNLSISDVVSNGHSLIVQVLSRTEFSPPCADIVSLQRDGWHATPLALLFLSQQILANSHLSSTRHRPAGTRHLSMSILMAQSKR